MLRNRYFCAVKSRYSITALRNRHNTIDRAYQMKSIFSKGQPHDIQSAIDFLVVTALLVYAGVWAWREYMTSAPYVDPERYPVRGIDVSAHNGMMNFEAAAADGIEFVFIKASEGTDFRDSNFRLNYDKAREAGIMVGAYHYFRFDSDGVDQAVNLLGAVGDRQLDIGIAVDVEEEGNARGVPVDSIKMRLRDMTEYLNLRGWRVTFYSNRDGYYDLLMPEMEGMPIWICSFYSTPLEGEWTFWQYDHRGKVSGVRGDVDLDAFGGSREDWRQFILDTRQAPERRGQYSDG